MLYMHIKNLRSRPNIIDNLLKMVDIIKCIAPEKWMSTYEIVDVLAASGEEEQRGEKLVEEEGFDHTR